MPFAIEALTVSDEIDAMATGDVFRWFNAKKGLVCLNGDQVIINFSLTFI